MRHAVTLTLREAAAILDPPIPELGTIIKALGWKPAAHRHTGRAGRPVAAYDATRIMQLHQALLPFSDQIPYPNRRPTGLPEMRGAADWRHP